MNFDVSLNEMVDTFIREKREQNINYLEELKRKGKEMSYDEFIKVVVTSFPDHKWSFERFNNTESLKWVAFHLKAKEKKIKNVKTFDELLRIINDIRIEKFGDLTKYDTALALGAYIGKLPDKIFMHAGPKEAAKDIFGAKYSKKVRYLIKPNRIQYIDVNDLPEEFNELKDTPYLIEDCLCFIYSRYLSKKNE